MQLAFAEMSIVLPLTMFPNAFFLFDRIPLYHRCLLTRWILPWQMSVKTVPLPEFVAHFPAPAPPSPTFTSSPSVKSLSFPQPLYLVIIDFFLLRPPFPSRSAHYDGNFKAHFLTLFLAAAILPSLSPFCSVPVPRKCPLSLWSVFSPPAGPRPPPPNFSFPGSPLMQNFVGPSNTFGFRRLLPFLWSVQDAA